MPISPNSTTSKNLLKYARVYLNDNFLSTPVPLTLNENLLQREVFDYDFNQEKVFLEIAASEREAKRKASSARENNTSTSYAFETATTNADDEVLAKKTGSSLNLKSDEAPKKKLIRRTSEEEMAAAISASLREY